MVEIFFIVFYFLKIFLDILQGLSRSISLVEEIQYLASLRPSISILHFHQESFLGPWQYICLKNLMHATGFQSLWVA